MQTTFAFKGGGKRGWPIHSPPWQDKASNLCRWLSGWRKTRLVHSFPTLTSESINLTLSWIHTQPLLFRGGEKLCQPILSPSWHDKVSTLSRWLSYAQQFSPPDNLLNKLMFNIVKVGKEWASPVFPHPLKSNSYVYSWQGKNGCVFPQTINYMHNRFPPPDNLLNKVDV